VIDPLNLEPSFEHHYRSYGFWAPAIAEFERAGITRWAGTPQFAALIRSEDPYSYRDRLTMPMFHRQCRRRPIFSARLLKGEFVDAAESIASFYQSILSDTPRPSFSWNFADDGSIRVRTESKPSAVRLWQAENANARDFRLATIGAAYTSSSLSDQGDGLYVGMVPQPKQGWTAYFVEMTFPTGGPYSFKFTTGVRVTPDRLPFGPPPETEGGCENVPSASSP